jgi:YebC/PmpR family DNA-binding regulatory protein
MAGHNKWSSIKHKKAKTDAQKGKAFSKVAREIVMAVKLGGEDQDMNPRLRLALQKAKEVNMPNDNIKRAIQKGAGGDSDSNLEENVYEAYAPNGVALIITTLTDNKNRTIANIKAIINKGGGNMATPGAVSYMFDTKGLLLFEPGVDEDAVMEVALGADAENFETQDDGSIEVVTDPGQLETVRKAFEEANLEYSTATITMIPNIAAPVNEEQAEKIMNLIDKLDDDDDVQDVYTNMDVSE